MSAPAEHTVIPVEAPMETATRAPETTAPIISEPAVEPTLAPQVEETAAPATTSITNSVLPATTEATQETSVTEPVKAIESGYLGYKAPGLIKSFKFSKKHFWLGDEPVSHDKLSSYLRGEKPEVAQPTAAWSSQTGKGLLFFTKHAEEKASPAGVLNLSEASTMEKQSPHEFSFKLHGHKHTFKAADDAERDGWYVSIEKAVAEAKSTKDTVVSSERYKESLSHLSKPAVVVGGAAPAVSAARKSVEAPKIEEPARTGSSSSSSDEEAAAKKKKTQSRSVSRNKRSSIFGNFMNKKEEHDTKKEIKKEEKEEAKEIKKEEQHEAKTEELLKESASVVAPLDAEAVAARAIEAPVAEASTVPAAVTETTPAVETTEARPKPSKRSSIFGSFFEKVRSPAHEKKESEVAPIVPPKDTIVSAEPPVIPAPSTETTIESPAPAITETVAPAPTIEEPVMSKTKTDAVSPRKEKEGGFFGGMMNKVRAKSPANVDRSAVKTETAPAVPHKTEETTPAAIVEAPSITPAEPTTVVDEPVMDAAHKATTPKENRRKSYFGGSSNKISSLFRKPSQAVHSNEAKKENVAPAVEDQATAVETPAATEGAPISEATTTEAVAGEVKPVSEVVPETSTVGHEHKSSPIVSAAA